MKKEKKLNPFSSSIPKNDHLYKEEEFSTVNPFTYRYPGDSLSIYEWIKVILFSITLAPIRLILVFVFLLLAFVIVQLLLINIKLDENGCVSPWRRKAVYGTIQYTSRLVLFCCGFWWIPIIGKLDKDAPIVVINHTSMFDFLLVLSFVPACFVSKKEVSEMPLFGGLFRAMHCIPVDRLDPDSRKKTVQAIKDHTTNYVRDGPEYRSPLVIFPEATTTNGSALISFKLGAFLPGSEVQPIMIRYPFVHDELAWLPGGTTFRNWRHLCQFSLFATVDFLPIMTPHKEETPAHFASRVRRSMASHANLPLTSHSFDDLVLQKKAEKFHYRNMEMVEMGKASDVAHTRMTLKTSLALLEKFSKLDEDRNGVVTYSEWCTAQGLPEDSELCQRLFQTLDVDETGTLDFREYLIGMALLASDEMALDDRLQLVFRAIDADGSGSISFEEMKVALQRFASDEVWTDEAVENLYACAHVPKNEEMDYDAYVEFIKQNPVYFHLFFNNYIEKAQASLASQPSQLSISGILKKMK